MAQTWSRLQSDSMAVICSGLFETVAVVHMLMDLRGRAPQRTYCLFFIIQLTIGRRKLNFLVSSS